MNDHDGDDGPPPKVDVHLHFHLPDNGITIRHVIGADAALTALIRSIKEDFSAMSNALQDKIDKLVADVQAETTANASAITLINGFAAQLAAAIAAASAAGATPEQLAALDDLAGAIEQNSAQLTQAVTANTPAAPAPAAAAPAASGGDTSLAGGAASDSGAGQ